MIYAQTAERWCSCGWLLPELTAFVPRVRTTTPADAVALIVCPMCMSFHVGNDVSEDDAQRAIDGLLIQLRDRAAVAARARSTG